ncbi:hypothetical protein B0A78_02205 [Flavobacterium columnare NBRC 100251 = ATCC 23463]|uniref:hypothetical protein n=1 Tax=Flavobacterium columnare TaxID=996 RepID=UPI000BE8B009|nr:hypothetical protein [Flavobacterium columnare]MBF6654308.1 hypothetical protein [Flavobacterium columnare]MBF6656744.1 hypothetical protein [Flavobacterium columnare]PDS26444.1 hypothetical protein B0A78_02205 [Flavobacterium columnare NBRC 100251 = ATCC 23463]GEM57491.1 hypothetical protein FC1_07290 [Flavobacterium columnare NBRC 100251 = ATCC 23463]
MRYTNASDKNLGFLIHPSFILDADSLIPYGFLDIKVGDRTQELPIKKKMEAHNILSIEEKEDYNE